MINYFIDKFGILKAWIVRNGKLVLVTLVAIVAAAGLVNLPNDKVPYIDFNGEIIAFSYTDDNSNEDVLIRTNRETYGAFNEDEVITSYVLIGNNSGKGQNMSIYPMLADYAKDVQIARLYQDVPYDKEIPVYEEQCKEVFNATTSETNTVCLDTVIGTSTQIAYQDEWRDISLLVFDDEFEIGVSLSKGNLERKPIPSKYRADVKSVAYIGADEIAYFKMRFRGVPPGITDEFFIEVVGDEGAYGHLDPTITSDWVGYFSITVTSTITGTHTNFPLYYNGVNAPADCTSILKSDGTDIRITTSTAIGSNILDHELVSATTTAGNWEIYFRDPALAASEIYYVWCGNAGASDISTSSTWNSNYKAVYHMNDASGGIVDSTANGNNGTENGNPTYRQSGVFGSAISFDGTGDYFQIATSPFLSNIYSIQTWAKSNSLTTRGGIYGEFISDSTKNYLYWAEFIHGFVLDQFPPSGGAITGAEIDLNWTYVVVNQSASNSRELFTNASSDGTSSETYSGSAPTSVIIGSRPWVPDALNGEIDELRLVDGATLSTNWIDAEYKNQNDPSIFWAVGSWVPLAVRRIIMVQ